MRIPEEAIPFTYEESKRTFENKTSVKDSAENINQKHGIKITSASDYIYYFKYLMTGIGSCRSLSKFTQEYYLERIAEDYGNEQFEKSLTAFKKLFEKLEKDNPGTKVAMRKIYEKYKTIT